MMRRRRFSRLLGIVLPALCIALLMPGYLPRVSAQVGGGFDLSWSTVDGGGATPISGGVFSLNGTVGQPDAGAASGGTFALASGFWHPAASALPTLSISDVSLAEGNVGTTNFVFTVTLSPASNQTVTVQVQSAAGNATEGVDYTALPLTTVTFAPGVTSQTVTVGVIGDTLPESTETFAVNLSGATNATIADAQGIGTITDDDGTPSLSINNVSVAEGDSGTVNAVFTVTLSPASTQTVTVVAKTAAGSGSAVAAVGTDYTATGPTTLTFAPGATAQTVTVAVIGDTSPEPDETFAVTLSGATNATIVDGEGVGTIVDDDAQAEYQNSPGDDDTEDKPKETDEQRQQRHRTDRSSQDDIRTEGNVVEIRRNEDPPVVVIANKDGLVELRLIGDARHELRKLKVGQYVVASGEKEHEQLYIIDDLSIE
jgi:hypothetical protein